MKALICSILVLALSLPVLAVTYELMPAQDAYICDCQPDVTNPNGGTDYLYHGRYGSCYDRTLIQWDLSTIPVGSVVVSAEMRLYCESVYGSESGTPVYYMIDGTWDETTVTFNNQPSFDTEISVTGYWPDLDTWYSVDVLPFVQAWLDGSHANQGIYCFCQGVTATCVPGFWSSNYAEEALRPSLVIVCEEQDMETATWGELKDTGV
jgi:hypothetical protein